MLSVVVEEDNYPVRKGLVHCIKEHLPLFEVVGEAADGVSGQETILQLRPEIVLTDIRLPGISGLKLIDEVQKVYNPRFIVISGYSEFEYAREALRLGVLAYLTKPINETELASTLRNAASHICGNSFVNIASILRLPPDDPNAQKQRLSGRKQSYHVQQALQHIHIHFAEYESVSDIAEALGLSASYLGKLFKDEMTFTIHEYRMNYRIAKAVEMMANPQYKIYEVARRVGIENQRYFSHLFKRSMGMTPNEYRNALSCLKSDK